MGPAAPTAPVGPVPVWPVCPFAPVGPTAPVGPSGPVAPTGPVGPGSASSMSASVFAVMVAAILSPTWIARADEPSWARVIVSTSPTIAVTRTISAFVGSGMVSGFQIVALNGAAGK